MSEDHLEPLEMQVRLESRDGQLITYARLQLMYEPPEVVVWGDRLFILGHGANKAKDGLFIYHESVNVMIVDPVERLVPFEPVEAPP